jgi:hypothetical protein
MQTRLDPVRVEPGGSSSLELVVQNNGSVSGIGVAKVGLYCDSEKWSQLFRVSYVFPGVIFPDEQLIVDSETGGFEVVLRVLSLEPAKGTVKVVTVSQDGVAEKLEVHEVEVSSERFVDDHWSTVLRVQLTGIRNDNIKDRFGVVGLHCEAGELSEEGTVGFVVKGAAK